MPYTPPLYNVVSVDLNPIGSPSVVIPNYNVVSVDLNNADGGSGGITQSISFSGSTRRGTGVFRISNYLQYVQISSTYNTQYGIPNFYGPIKVSLSGAYNTQPGTFNVIGPQRLTPYGVNNTQYGNPLFFYPIVIVPVGVYNTQFGTPTVTLLRQYVFPTGVKNTQYGDINLRLTQTVKPDSFKNTNYGFINFVLSQVVSPTSVDSFSSGNPTISLVAPIEINGYVGEFVEHNLTISNKIFFQAVAAVGTSSLASLNDRGWDVDLLNSSCCPPLSNTLEIGFETPQTVYWGEKTYARCELSTGSRFKANAYDGLRVELKDTRVYIEAPMYVGEFCKASLEAVYNVRLCRGNFIPDTSNLIVELVYEYGECEANFGFVGEIGSTLLTVGYAVSGYAFDGLESYTDLIIDPKWTAEAYDGLSAERDLIEITGYSGESASAEFEELAANAIVGETASADMKIKYEVEFVEQGCFDNEYVYINEDGDAIEEKFNPVPVEKDPFRHEIKARCF